MTIYQKLDEIKKKIKTVIELSSPYHDKDILDKIIVIEKSIAIDLENIQETLLKEEK